MYFRIPTIRPKAAAHPLMRHFANLPLVLRILSDLDSFIVACRKDGHTLEQLKRISKDIESSHSEAVL